MLGPPERRRQRSLVWDHLLRRTTGLWSLEESNSQGINDASEVLGESGIDVEQICGDFSFKIAENDLVILDVDEKLRIRKKSMKLMMF